MTWWLFDSHESNLLIIFGDLLQAEDKLSPAEKVLEEVSTLMGPLKPQLDNVKDLLQNARNQAKKAQENAGNAEGDAAAANKVRYNSSFGFRSVNKATVTDWLQRFQQLNS